MKLTNEEMIAAHVARQISLDPSGPIYNEIEGPDAKRMREQHRLGKKILRQYSLTYTHRYRIGTAHPDTPANAAGILEVDSGHIATQEARRIAVFKHKRH